MTASNPTLRETLNNGVLQQKVDVDRTVCMGDLMSRLIVASAADETAIDTTAGTAGEHTLAAAPSCVLHANAVAGTFTGQLALLIGDVNTVSPASGEMLWAGPGSAELRFNVGDAITDLDIWYTVPADTTSLMDRTLGQSD